MTLRSTVTGAGLSAAAAYSGSTARRPVRIRRTGLSSTLTLRHHELFRAVDEVTLDDLHAELPQHGHGVRVFDALGDGFDLELHGLLDPLLDDGVGVGVCREALI